MPTRRSPRQFRQPQQLLRPHRQYTDRDHFWESSFEGDVAVAKTDVIIHYGPTSIYADYATYNPHTHDVLALGNVRLYKDGDVFVGDRVLYNLDTKLLRSTNLRGAAYPFYFKAESVSSLDTTNAFQMQHATITTSDASKPDYSIRARSMRIYSNDHIVLSDVYL